METLPETLKEVVSKLYYTHIDEVDLIESIIDVNEENKEEIAENIFDFLGSRKRLNFIYFVFGVINYASIIRAKERRTLSSLCASIFKRYSMNAIDFEYNNPLASMLQVDCLCPKNEKTDEYVYGFEEGTLEKIIYDDNTDDLAKLLSLKEEEKNHIIQTKHFINIFQLNSSYFMSALSFSALFGSVQCFKYLLLNDGNDEDQECCRFAIMGGNAEIVHICEQNGMRFENCLCDAVRFHRFDLYEWLEQHFEYKPVPLYDCLKYYNEPIFYFLVEKGADLNEKDDEMKTALHYAASNGELGAVEYLVYKGADINEKAKHDYTPTGLAICGQHQNIVDFLMSFK